MKATEPSRAIALCGTEQPDVPGRVLTAGPLSVEFDNGQLRYLKVNGVEVLRVIGFLIRDKNWGTATPAISDLKVDQRSRRLLDLLPRRNPDRKPATVVRGEDRGHKGR